jgi:flagellar biosynthesis/type III secretory pathway protein FliH
VKNKINFLLVLGILFCSSKVKSQTDKEFSKGWNEGYEAGYCEYNLLHHKMKPLFLTPFVPTYAIAYTTYQDGYKLGFAEGKEKFMQQS